MSWQEFEFLVGEAFRLQGYSVVETGGAGPDGGVDLVLRKGNEKFLVQCKQWKAVTVGVTVVRELFGVMAAQGAAGGFVVTSGKFTDEAKKFTEGRNLKLLDGQVLSAMIKSATANRTKQAPVGKLPVQEATATPSCPVCSKPMVQRQAKRGSSAGNLFWGCTGYPACKGTRQVA
jgi:restriction system protein